MEACYLPAALDNLIHLELFFSECYNWKLVTELLNRSPKLEDLVLEHRVRCVSTYYTYTYQHIYSSQMYVLI